MVLVLLSKTMGTSGMQTAAPRRESVSRYRMRVFVGHFGSGKTEVALGVALQAAERGEPVTLVDLDLVKPYFRCRVLAPSMAERGVRIVSPDGEPTLTELPVVPPNLCELLAHGGPRLIVDVGGDPVGALVLGAVMDSLPREEVELLLLLNFTRPKTDTVERAVAMARAIEAAARLPLTGLVANTHLLGETTPDMVREGLRLTERAGDILGLPVSLVAVEERLAGAFPTGFAPCPLLPLRRLVYPPFERVPLLPAAGRPGATTGRPGRPSGPALSWPALALSARVGEGG